MLRHNSFYHDHNCKDQLMLKCKSTLIKTVYVCSSTFFCTFYAVLNTYCSLHEKPIKIKCVDFDHKNMKTIILRKVQFELNFSNSPRKINNSHRTYSFANKVIIIKDYIIYSYMKSLKANMKFNVCDKNYIQCQ